MNKESKEISDNTEVKNLLSIDDLEKILSENPNKRLLLVPDEFFSNILKMIEKMESRSENYISGKQIDIWSKQVNERREKNRNTIEKILFNLHNLQRAVSEDGNLNDFQKYTSGIVTKISENDKFITLQNNEASKEETKKLLKKYYKILDDYLASSEESINTMNVKLSNIESKKAILRQWYGYGLRDRVFERDEYGNIIKDENGNPIYKVEKDKMGRPLKDKDGNIIYYKEQKVKKFLDLCEVLYLDPRTLYNYKKELLDELAPAFFGIDGIYL